VCNDKCQWENNMLCVSVIFGSNDNIIVCVCVWLCNICNGQNSIVICNIVIMCVAICVVIIVIM
jgi:hypothetical protein